MRAAVQVFAASRCHCARSRQRETLFELKMPEQAAVRRFQPVEALTLMSNNTSCCDGHIL